MRLGWELKAKSVDQKRWQTSLFEPSSIAFFSRYFFCFILAALAIFDPVQSQSYDELSLSQRAEFEKLSIELGVLGGTSDRSSFGLLGHQFRILSQMEFAYQTKSPEWESLASELFSLHQAQLDWTYIFRRQSNENPYRLQQAYESIFSKFKEPSFHLVLQYLRIEYQQRLFQIQHPVFAQGLVYPGIGAWEIHYLNENMIEEAFPLVNRSLLGKLERNESFNFQDFLSLHPRLSPASLSFEYLQYRSFQTVMNQNFESLEEFQDQLKKTAVELKNEMQDVAQLQISDQENLFFAERADFYWSIYLATKDSNFRFDADLIWSSYADEVEDLNSLLWLHLNFAGRWPNLEDHISLTDLHLQFAESKFENLSLLQRAIDTSIDEDFDFHSEDRILYFKSVALIESAHWLDETSDFPFSKLSTSLRNIICARLFPTLSLRMCRALLEDRVIEFKPEEWAQVPLLFYESPFEREQFFQKKRSLNLLKPENAREMAVQLVKDYQQMIAGENEDASEPLQESLVLFDGRELPLVHLEREIRKDEINQKNLEFPIWYGWLPDSLANWINLQFFPYDGFWKDEILRFENEVERQKIIHEYSKKLETLDSKEDWMEIERELNALITDENGFPRLDYSSPAVYAAGFWSGMKQTSAPQLAASAGMGFVFYFVFKGAGGKWAFRLIAGDTAVRIGSAHYLREDASKGFIHLDLSKGFSLPVLPIGYWTAEALQDSFKIFSGIAFSSPGFEKLQAYYDFGRLSPEFGAFLFGSSAAHFAGGKTYGFLRHRERVKKQITEQLNKLEKLKQEIPKLEAEKLILQERLQLARPESRDFNLNQRNIYDLERRLFELRFGLVSTNQSPLRFYIQRSLQSAVHLTKRFYYLAPRSPAKRNWSQKLNFWRRSRSFGIAQLEQKIKILEAKIQSKDQKFVRSSSRLNTEFFRTYETQWKSIQSTQDKLLDRLDRLVFKQEKESPLTGREASRLRDDFDSLFNELVIQNENLLSLTRLVQENSNVSVSISVREKAASSIESLTARRRTESVQDEVQYSVYRFLSDEALRIRQAQLQLHEMRRISLKSATEGRAPLNFTDRPNFRAVYSHQQEFRKIRQDLDELYFSLQKSLGRNNSPSGKSTIESFMQSSRQPSQLSKPSSFSRSDFQSWWSSQNPRMASADELPFLVSKETHERVVWEGLEIFKSHSEVFIGERLNGSWRLLKRFRLDD